MVNSISSIKSYYAMMAVSQKKPPVVHLQKGMNNGTNHNIKKVDHQTNRGRGYIRPRQAQ